MSRPRYHSRMVATHRVLQTTAVFMAEALWRTLHRVFIHSSLVNSFIFIYFPFLMCGGAECMSVCMHVLPVYGHICARVCVGLRLMSGINIIHSSTLFIEAGSLSQTQSSLIWSVSLVCLFWGCSVPPFQTGIADGPQCLCGFIWSQTPIFMLISGFLTAESSPHPFN